MALGVTVDFNANLGNITGQVDRMNSQLNRFQVQAETMSSRVSKAFGALGVGLSIAGIGAFVKSGIDAADALSKMASRTGIAVEELAGLKLAADLSDTSLETLGKAVNKLSVYVTTYAADAKALGITSKDNSEAFAQLADVLTGIDDAQTRAALGTKILGRSWQDLAPLLLQGGEAIREQVKQGKALNPVTTEMAAKAAAFNDSLTIQEARLKGVATQMAGPFVDAEAKLLEYLIDTNTELGSSGDSFSVYRTAINETVIVIAALNNILDRAGKGAGRLAAEVVALAHLDLRGYAVIEEAFQEDIANAQARYEKFVNDIRNPNKDQIIPAIKPVQTDAGAVARALGVTDSAGEASDKASKAMQSSADKLAASADRLIAGLRREIALRGDSSRLAAMQYDIASGAYQGLGALQKNQLLSLSAEKDAIEINIKAYEEYDQVIADGQELAKKQRAEMDGENARLERRFAAPRLDLNAGIADAMDARAAGIIPDDAQLKLVLDKMGRDYNKLTADAESATEQMSEFAVQAARNMETAFADFLFDPFENGINDMGINFLKAVQRMAADAAAAKIMEGLFGGKGSDAGSGLLGGLLSVAGAAIGGAFGGAETLVAAGNSPRFAGGGAHSGGLRIVGENGPELEATGPSRIFNAQQTKALLSGSESRSGPIIVNNNFSIGADVSRQSQQQIAAAAGRSIQQAMLRGR